ncbi:MAG TPA: hypothetical protein VIR54_11710, partial [Vicinamibacterales bacterium]
MADCKALIKFIPEDQAKQARHKNTGLRRWTVDADNSTVCLKIYTSRFRWKIAWLATNMAVVAAAAAGCMLG